MRCALFGEDGKAQDLIYEGKNLGKNPLFLLSQSEQTFCFSDVQAKTVPSFFQSFSAPVIIEGDWQDEDIVFLTQHETDPFARFDAIQKYFQKLIESWMHGAEPTEKEKKIIEKIYSSIFENALKNPALTSTFLQLPSEGYYHGIFTKVEIDRLHEALERIKTWIATTQRKILEDLYKALEPSPTIFDADSVAQRALKNRCLAYLVHLDPVYGDWAEEHYYRTENMTLRYGAAHALNVRSSPARDRVLAEFSKMGSQEPQVLEKYFRLEATLSCSSTLERVRTLMQDTRFDNHSPNHIRALLVSFATFNTAGFHASSGEGYRFWGEHIEALDAFNGVMAARCASCFSLWRRYDQSRQSMIYAEVQRLLALPTLSKQTYEVLENIAK